MRALPGHAAAPAEIAVDRPLGVGTPTDDRRTTTLGFPPGAALLFHTDGLVGEIIDTGFLRLSSATRPGTAATMCDHHGHRRQRPSPDDVALTIRRTT